MKVLYIEDNPMDAELTRRALDRASMNIETEVLTNLRNALARLLENPDFDILLSDFRLPDGSGLEIVSFLRERGIQRPAIILTGSGDESVAVASFKSGAMDYIVKEGDYLARLPTRLISAVERHRADLARRDRSIRVLYAENDPNDIILTERYLARNASHIRLHAVQSAGEVLRICRGDSDSSQNKTVNSPPYDVILLDYRLPEMTALDLMREIRRAIKVEIPVVFITGQGSEEAAVQALRMGAADYLVKHGEYLAQLPTVLENAFYKAELIREKEALKRSEEVFRLLAENAQDVIYRYRLLPDEGVEYISPSVLRIAGYPPEAFYANPHFDEEIIYPDDREKMWAMGSIQEDPQQSVLLRWICKDGRIIWVEHRSTPIFDSSGQLVAIEGIARDITERRQRERELEVIATVSAALRSAPNQAEMLPGVLDHVVEITGADAGLVILFDWANTEIVIELGCGRFLDKTGLRIPLYPGVSGMLSGSSGDFFASGQPVVLASSFPVGFLDGVDTILSAPLKAYGSPFGALLVGRSKKGRAELECFNPEETKLLGTLADNLANAIQRTRLFESLQHSNAELVEAYNATIEGWSKALDLRDKETEHHTQQVTEMTLRLAYSAGYRDVELSFLRWGALLHDIGKLGVPDRILQKPGPLTPEEWEVMRKHPEYAYQFLSPIHYLGRSIDIPYCHHERWDGTGYPHAMKGEEIPLSARLFCIVDVWEALTNDRVYRPAWPKDRAAEYIRQQSGKHFDPAVVDLFFKTF